MPKMVEVPNPALSNCTFEGTFKIVSGELKWVTLRYSPEDTNVPYEDEHWEGEAVPEGVGDHVAGIVSGLLPSFKKKHGYDE